MLRKDMINYLPITFKLVEMKAKKDQCKASVANMTEELKHLSDKIDTLGGVSSGAPHSK